jgi:hypothetical protein
MSKTDARENNAQRLWTSWLLLGIIILFVVFVRVRLSDFPLERDEGEYAYMGQLILQNIPPYSEAYNMKFPGTYLMYAGIMALFGQTIEGVHIGLMIVNCLTILLVFLLSRKIVSESAALAASATYAMLSLSPSVLGFAGHATHFVILPALGGILLLLHALKKEKLPLYFFSGILLGLSFIMKQPGIFFVLFGATYILWQRVYSNLSGLQANKLAGLRAKWLTTLPAYQISVFSLGAVLPFLVIIIWLYTVGVFDKFWFWTIKYTGKYGAQIPFSDAFAIFKNSFSSVIDGFFLLWCLSAGGFIAAFFHRTMKINRAFIILFTAFSFLTVCPGFYFREHYFVTFLPAVAILIGIFFDYVESRILYFKPSHVKLVCIGLFAIAMSVGLFHQRGYLFQESPATLCRSIYGGNPFPESIEIAKFIESRSSKDDKVAVLGSEPQIYFYSGRHSAAGYIYMYGLMEIHDYSLKMQQEMISEIEAARPKFIVFVPIDTSWLVRPESEKYIFRWLDEYIRKNYVLVGVTDIVAPEKTVYKWYDDARQYTIQSPYYMLIFEKI